MFELVTGTRAVALLDTPSLWETVRILFHFRNMIAHGRSVTYTWLPAPSAFPASILGADFSGGYKKVEEYLLTKGLLDRPHHEVANNWLYFSDDIADHFWKAANDFVQEISDKASVPLPSGGHAIS